MSNDIHALSIGTVGSSSIKGVIAGEAYDPDTSHSLQDDIFFTFANEVTVYYEEKAAGSIDPEAQAEEASKAFGIDVTAKKVDDSLQTEMKRVADLRENAGDLETEVLASYIRKRACGKNVHAAYQSALAEWDLASFGPPAA
jgi:hypothetical protein